mgnify:FL=1
MSRLEYGEAGDGVPDEFHDAELFRVTTEPTTDKTVVEEDKWITKMYQFLSIGLPPQKRWIGTNGSAWKFEVTIFV